MRLHPFQKLGFPLDQHEKETSQDFFCKMAESFTISEKPFLVIFTEMFLPLTILSMI